MANFVLPLRVYQRSGSHRDALIQDANDDFLADLMGEDAEAKANADAIVRAVNCHDDLLAALKGLLAHLGPDGYIPSCGEPATRRARAAIAKAEAS